MRPIRFGAKITGERRAGNSHAAIVSRELRLPAVVGIGNASHLLHDEQEVTVSCAEGYEGFIYEGEVDYVATTANTALCPKKKATIKAAPNRNFFVVIPLSTNPDHFPMLVRVTNIMHMTPATAVGPIPMRMPRMPTRFLSECGTGPIEKGDCQRHPE
ncbi:MAG: PEP-utilizing enzyme [Methylocella sp.]